MIYDKFKYVAHDEDHEFVEPRDDLIYISLNEMYFNDERTCAEDDFIFQWLVENCTHEWEYPTKPKELVVNGKNIDPITYTCSYDHVGFTDAEEAMRFKLQWG